MREVKVYESIETIMKEKQKDGLTSADESLRSSEKILLLLVEEDVPSPSERNGFRPHVAVFSQSCVLLSVVPCRTVSPHCIQMKK